MQTRDFNLKVRTEDKGTFVGLGAVYNNVDLGGDVIDPGAFTRTLSAGKSFPVLWQHDASNPIGTCKITDTSAGLQVNGKLELSDPTAQKAYTFMQAGIVKGLSIGFDTLQSNMVGDVRHLTEVRLWEISCVTFPMNESAQVTGVKAMSDEKALKHLKGINEDRKGIDRHQRSMRMHLKALFDVPDDDDADDPNADPGLIDDSEDDDDDSEDMNKSLAIELQKLAELAASKKK